MSLPVQQELDIDAGPKPCRSPVCWMGGKSRSAKHIIAEMPGHGHYVEVFGGGGHVLAQKPPSRLETYNDANEDLVNFFEVLCDNADALVARLRLVPVARATFESWAREWQCGRHAELPSIERAARWFTIVRQCFSSVLRHETPLTWRYAVDPRGTRPSAWESSKEALYSLANRFRFVQIECADFRRIIGRYDSLPTLFYCDPPYVGTEAYYTARFAESDHRDLADLLHGVEGKAMVSYYDCDLVTELYSAWRRASWETPKWSEKKNGSIRQRATELLLMNFDESGERLKL